MRGGRILQLALPVVWLALTATAVAASGASAIEALVAEGEFAKALERLETATSIPDPEKAVLLARIHLGLGDWGRSLKEAERAAKLGPESAAAHLVHAQALSTKMGEVSPMRAMMSIGPYKRALARALELDPDNVDVRTEEIGYLTYAPGIAGGDKQKAQKRIDDLKTIDLRQAMQMQAGLSREVGDDNGSIEARRALLEHDPDDKQAALDLALALIRAERFEESDPILLGLELSDDQKMSLSAIYQLGRSRVVGNYDVASGLKYFDRYLAGADPPTGLPSKAHAYWRRGEGLALEGDLDGARASLEEALRRDPNLEQAREALKGLAR
ncbi:MAG: tetratricopeptide repeat protein [Acidobacteriota bacterium]|nr:tetratricopeptide repeat protein [Acidobacteriota bacterium]